jgi:hypothetical protein
VQIALTKKNEKWLRSQATKWSATPTLLANQAIAESIEARRVKFFGRTAKQWDREVAIRMGK